mgnify:CR=1 FL=1|tara:strand:- start:2778 stop:2948 length:171 start_codon:yes stop_codon:yes gene_type:complete
MALPLLIPAAVGIAGFVGGFFTGSGTSKIIKYAAIGGVIYFLVATPNGKNLVKKVL